MRRGAVLLAIVSACIAQVVAQGPPETALNMADCTASVAGTVAVTGGLEELSKLLGNVSTQIPTLTASGKAVTLFAPSNAAIGALQAALSGAHPTISQTQMQSVLAQVVRYHMLPTALHTANMSVGDVLSSSLTGHKITVTAATPWVALKGDASNSTAHINQPNIVICKSIMHIVDAVLLPVPISDVAAGHLSATPSAPAVAAAAAAANATSSPRQPTGTSRPAKPTAKKPTKPTANNVTKNSPGLPKAGARKQQLDATSATSANTMPSGAAEPAAAPGAALQGATAGALGLMVAAAGVTLLIMG